MKLKFKKSKSYLKRFRISVNLPQISIKGPLGVCIYQIPHGLPPIRVHPYRGVLKWFYNSTFFLNWLLFAQRSVSVGFYINMTLNGVAFKVDYLHYAHALNFDLGYSHHVTFLLPEHAKTILEKRKFTLYSPNFTWLTDAARRIKKLRWPDPYRGKGVIYRDEKLKLKPGKQRQ